MLPLAFVQALPSTACLVFFGSAFTQVVRNEDFPVMPVESVSFSLKPVGFFEGELLRRRGSALVGTISCLVWPFGCGIPPCRLHVFAQAPGLSDSCDPRTQQQDSSLTLMQVPGANT